MVDRWEKINEEKRNKNKDKKKDTDGNIKRE